MSMLIVVGNWMVGHSFVIAYLYFDIYSLPLFSAHELAVRIDHLAV